MNYFLKIVCGVFLVVTVGFGCRDSDAGANVDARVEIDRALKLYAEKPAAWDRVKFNTLYKNPRTQSGFSYVAGGSNFGFGARSEDEAETLVVVHVIAIPRAEASNFEKNKYPATAERRFETPEYVIYTATPRPEDGQVKRFVETLEYRP